MIKFYNIPITPSEGREVSILLKRLCNRFRRKAPENAYPIVHWLTDSFGSIIELLYYTFGERPTKYWNSDEVYTVRLLPKEIAMMHYAFDYLGKTFTVFQLPAVPEYEYIQKRVLYLLRITEDTPKPPPMPAGKEVEKNAA